MSFPGLEHVLTSGLARALTRTSRSRSATTPSEPSPSGSLASYRARKRCAPQVVPRLVHRATARSSGAPTLECFRALASDRGLHAPLLPALLSNLGRGRDEPLRCPERSVGGTAKEPSLQLWRVAALRLQPRQ